MRKDYAKTDAEFLEQERTYRDRRRKSFSNSLVILLSILSISGGVLVGGYSVKQAYESDQHLQEFQRGLNTRTNSMSKRLEKIDERLDRIK